MIGSNQRHISVKSNLPSLQRSTIPRFLHSLYGGPFAYGEDIKALIFQILDNIFVILCSNSKRSDSFPFYHEGRSDNADNIHIMLFHYLKGREQRPGFV